MTRLQRDLSLMIAFGAVAFVAQLVLSFALVPQAADWPLWAVALVDGALLGTVLGAAWWLLFARAGVPTQAARGAPLLIAAVAVAAEFVLHEATVSWRLVGAPAALFDAAGVTVLLLPVALWLRWLHLAEQTSLAPIRRRDASPHRVAMAGIVGAVAVVAWLAVSGVMTLRHQAKLLQAQSELVNVAGRQRTHAHALARAAEDARQTGLLIAAADRLRMRAAPMATEADELARGLGRFWPVVRAHGRAMAAFDEVQQLRSALLAQTEAIIKAADRGMSARDLDAALRQLHEDADAYVLTTESAVAELQRAGEATAAELMRNASVAALLVLLLSGATLLGAVRPVSRIIANQQRRLRDHSASLERLTLVARITSSSVVICDARGRLTWVNDAFERLTGYAFSEVEGRRPGEFLQCPDTDPVTVQQMREALAAGEPVRVQVLNQGKHGNRYWLDIDIQPLRGEGGELDGFIGVQIDVTERIRLLRELRLVLENAAAGIVVQAADGRIVDANPEAERLLGLTVEQMRGRHSIDERWRAVRDDGSEFPGEQHPAMVALKTGQPVRNVVMGVHTPDGERRWLQVNAQPVAATSIDEARVVSSFTDITARREAEAARSAESRRMAAILDGTRAGTWEWNLQTEEIVVNERWAQISGMTLAEIAPRRFATWMNLVHPDDATRVARELSRHFAGDTPYFDCEMRIRHRDRGWTWVHDRGRVAQWTDAGEPLLMFGTHVDVDARVRAQIELQRAHGTLRGLFELSGIGIALTDLSNGALIDCNAALLELTGYRRIELQQLGGEALGLPQGPTADDGAEETTLRRRDGSRLSVLRSMTRVPQADGSVHLWTLVQDISPRKELERRLQRDAREDRLTGLANRTLFAERLEAAVAHSLATGEKFAVLFLDFDRFKLVNDSLGHDFGDRLLREIAQRLRTTLRVSDHELDRGDVVARFGGDEFVVLLAEVSRRRDAEAVAERLLNALAPVYVLDEHEIHSSASIGIVVFGEGEAGMDAETLLRNADTAMYEAKRMGRGCAVVFNEGMHSRLTRNLTVEAALRRALAGNDLELHYQPIVDLETGRMQSCEALLRWNHPTLGAVSPSEFVPIAEDSGLIVPIGAWVLRRACRQIAQWRREAPHLAPASVSVNVSRLQMNDPQRLLALVQDVLRETGIPPQCLQLEVTEREVMRDAAASRTLMRKLSALGVRLAMDDFGTGTSSLGCLREFPFDVIKIDRSFIHGVDTDADVLALIHATVTLVENLGMTSCAEGVETPAQVATLQSLGCRYGQGYLFSRPVSAERLLDAAALAPAAAR